MTLATKVLMLGILVSVVGGLFVLLIEELALNDDCNPCSYMLQPVWIFYPLIVGIGMVLAGLVWRQKSNPHQYR